jgi:kynurenine formamidase
MVSAVTWPGDMRLIDLSHTVGHGLVTYPGLPAPVISDHLSRKDSEGRYAPGTTFHIARIEMVANTGTYLDAPSHRWADGADTSQLALEQVAGLDAIVIDTHGIRKITPAVIRHHDLAGRAVLFLTRWSRFFGKPEYGNGRHPFVARETAEALVKAKAALVGIDSLNIDDTEDLERPAHSILLRANIPIVEHLTNLEEMPAEGSRFFAVPPKFAGVGTFSVRAFALLPA